MMKNSILSIYRKQGGINGIFLAFYTSVVCAPVLYDIATRYELSGMRVMCMAILLLICVVKFTSWVICKIQNYQIFYTDNRYDLKKWSIVFWAISFGILLVWYIGYTPGFIFSDLKVQLDQAVSGNYNDWHPVIQTLLVFTFPLKLTSGWIGSIILFQIGFCALVVSYMGIVILKYSNWIFALMSVLFIILNPITGLMSCYPLKDTSMAILGLLTMSFVVQIYFSEGKWLDSRVNRFFFSIIVVVTTLVRHNGILFTFPLVVAVCLFINRQTRIKILAVIILGLVCIKGPFYSVLQVENPDQRQIESLGLPLTIIGNVVAEHPEKLNNETREFAYSLAPKESWETNYDRGSFNTIKWSEGTDLSVIEEAGALAVLRMTWHCICVDFVSSMEAFLALTKVVYALDESSCFYRVGIDFEQYEVPYEGNRQIASILQRYTDVVYHSFLKYIFCYVGVMHLIMLFVMVGKSRLNVWEDWKRLLLCIPVFTYNFGTMLLLTGRDDRFFYISFVICPLTMVIMLVKKAG